MEFQILGPLRVEAPESALAELRSVKRRGLLAILLMHANKHVHSDRIQQWLWDDEVDLKQPNKEVQRLVSRVRRVLKQTSAAPTVTGGNGNYRLNIDLSIVDYYRFRGLCEKGRSRQREGDHQGVIDILSEALEMWPEDGVLANVPLPWARQEADRIFQEDFIPACRAYFEARLAKEHHDKVVRETKALLRRYDTDETLAELHMRGLIVVDEAAGVTSFYERFSRRLREEFDAEPGPQLAAVYRDLIAGEPPPAAFGRPEPPSLLPRDVPELLGREHVLRTLDEWLSGVPAVVVLHGVGGAGKTAIAKRWANTAAPRFPDGQLYYDINGYGADNPAKPAEVLARFLTVLGVENVPAELAGRVMMLRHRLRGTRTLVVLDNVANAAEIAPLLEATAPCPVLITSRRKLGIADARQVTVPALPREEAVTMLRRRIHDARVADESEVLDELAAVCADLPLGLRIAAEYVATRSQLSVRVLTDKLGAESRRRLLNAKDDGGEQTLRAVFASSCAALDPPANRLITFLGLHPSAYIGVPAAAAIAGMSRPETEDAFEALLGAHLVEQVTGDSHRLHDLVHAHVVDVAQQLTEAERSAAVRRMADYYLGTVVAAIRWVAPYLTEVSPLVSATPAVPSTFLGAEDALDWCVEHRSQVVAVSRYLAGQGLHAHVWRLIGLFDDVLNRYGDPHESAELNELAVRSSRVDGDRVGEAMLANNLGCVYQHLGRFADAESWHQRALAISREQDDVLGEAICLHNIGATWFARERLEPAGRQFGQVLALFDRLGHRPGSAKAHLWLGKVRHGLGDADIARKHYEAALDGVPECRGEALTRLAELHLDGNGDPAEAVDRCAQAVEVHRHERDGRRTSAALRVLAQAYLRLGEFEGALDAATEAVDLAEQCGDPLGKAAALDLVRSGRSVPLQRRHDDPASRGSHQNGGQHLDRNPFHETK